MSIATDIRDTVMIVDDESENLRVLATLLSQEGYTVRSFSNGKAALKSVQTDPPGLILLDIRMPDMNGFEICAQLKASASTKDIPVLFLSAIDAPGDKVRAFDLGGNDYIAKPFQSEEVLARINTHLTVSRYRRELEDMNRKLEVLVAERTEDLIAANKSLRKEIEARRSAQAALEESEERYRSIVTTASEGIISVDPQMIVTYSNEVIARMVGCDSADIIGRSGLDFIPAEDHDMIRSRFKKRMQGFGDSYESRLLRRDGRVRWVQISSAPIMDADQRFEGAVLLFTDITDRKKAEEALRQSNEFNQAVLKSLLVEIAVLDRNGKILAVNDSWMRFARKNKVAAVDRTGQGANYIEVCKKSSSAGSEEARLALEGITSVLQGRRDRFEFEYGCHTPNQQRWCLMIVTPFKGRKGGVIVTHRNITQSKQLEIELKQALEQISRLKNQIEADYVYLQEEIKLEHDYEQIIGNSDEIKYTLYRLEQVAKTDSTVIILGETGTGKELIARALHSTGTRADRPLIKVNCATLPAQFIESELFGHIKGAFTDAVADRQGRFALADKGTLFLDEIGELPMDLQPKLLRVLQDGEFERLGDSRTIKTDVRVIAATNRDLEALVQAGKFRKDLWYRLNVFPISIPPLRDRKKDIPALVNHFTHKFAKRTGKNITQIPERVLNEFSAYDWPGNVRELENVIERAIITSSGNRLRFMESLAPAAVKEPHQDLKSHADMEREHLLRVLEQAKWVIDGPKGAARILKMHPNTLRYRLKKLNIRRPT